MQKITNESPIMKSNLVSIHYSIWVNSRENDNGSNWLLKGELNPDINLFSGNGEK